MNYYYFTNQIHASSQEQRERIFEEIQNKPIGDNYYCRNDYCVRKGDCDIEFHVNMLGGINDEVYEILDLPLQYPDVYEEEWLFVECCGIVAHRIIHKDYWENIRTVEDTLEDYNSFGFEFFPEMLEIETFRKVYDNDNNLMSEEKKIVPYPIEKMPDDVRKEYEKWKEDPENWEENKKREKEEEERRVAEYKLKHSKENDDDDDLPF